MDELLAQLTEATEVGTGLPARWYTDRALLDLEQELLFRRGWQLAGPFAAELEREGDFVTCEVAGVPIVLVRNAEGSLNGFINACRHRGHEVALGRGNRSTLQCRYHGWTYDLSGALRGVPRAEREPGFDKACFPLLPVGVAAWGPLVFVTLDTDAIPFDIAFAELFETLDAHGLDFSGARYQTQAVLDFACNWKIYISNSIESYHIPTVHPGVSATHMSEEGFYDMDLRERFVYSCNPARDASRSDWLSYIVPPNWWLSRSGGGVVRARVARVLDVDATQVITYYFSSGELDYDAIEADAQHYRSVIGPEDRGACESVQRTVAADALRGAPGPLFEASEVGVRWFNAWLERALREGV